MIHDIGEHWGAGKPTWDPAKVKVPTLLILAEWAQRIVTLRPVDATALSALVLHRLAAGDRW